MNSIDTITVLGPTATGKTTFAVHLAKCLNTEIISADSRQVYKGMDIGTGKDLKEFIVDNQLIKHHLIDIVEAGEKYNVYQYQNDFLKIYKALREKQKIPILCGGTGLYIEAVLKGYKLIHVPVNEKLRKDLEKKSLAELAQLLAKMKKMHNTSDIDTKKRAIRSLEIEFFYKNNPRINLNYPQINSLIFGINYERDEVKKRITQRLKQRLEEGMVQEVKVLLDKGIPFETLEYYGLEYKFLSQFLQKKLSYDEMFRKLNIAIHQFSKRQMTWFRKMERNGFAIHWIDGKLAMESKIEIALNDIKMQYVKI